MADGIKRSEGSITDALQIRYIARAGMLQLPRGDGETDAIEILIGNEIRLKFLFM